MSTWRNANLLLAFLLEIAMLAGFFALGWHLGPSLWIRVALAVALTAIGIAMWWVWAAPKAPRRLGSRALFQFKIVMFALATAAWWAAGQELIAAIFGVLAVLHLTAAAAFRQV
jgi:uncharacterized protein DUF2568